MPALDHCQSQIVNALRKEHLTVLDKPAYIQDDDGIILIDIEATRKTNGSSRIPAHIYIEIKCFPGHNAAQELYTALGQYLFYRALLAKKQIAIPLYLALPTSMYENIFNPTVRQLYSDHQIKLIIVDLGTETITQWLE